MDIEHQMKEAVAGVIDGTDWAPPEGAILTECVVVMGWYYADGSYGSSHLTCGSPWSGHGLAARCVQRMESHLLHEIEDDG